MHSILNNEKKCIVCNETRFVEYHHIYYGTSQRKISDENGFTCYLCQWHHRGIGGVHDRKGHQLDLNLKRMCQAKYEETHTREEFMNLIRRNYLD